MGSVAVVTDSEMVRMGELSGWGVCRCDGM